MFANSNATFNTASHLKSTYRQLSAKKPGKIKKEMHKMHF